MQHRFYDYYTLVIILYIRHCSSQRFCIIVFSLPPQKCEVNWPLAFVCLHELSSGPSREKFRLCRGYEELFEGLLASPDCVDPTLISHFFQWVSFVRQDRQL